MHLKLGFGLFLFRCQLEIPTLVKTGPLPGHFELGDAYGPAEFGAFIEGMPQGVGIKGLATRIFLGFTVMFGVIFAIMAQCDGDLPIIIH